MGGHREGLWSLTASSLLGQGLNLALGMAASIPLARGLGPAGKGEFAFYSWGVNLGVMFLGWGWHSAVATLVSEQKGGTHDAVRMSRRRLLPVTVLLLLGAAGCASAGERGWAWASVAAALQIWGLPASGALIGGGRLPAYYVGLVTQSVVVLSGLLLLWQRSGSGVGLASGTMAAEHAVSVLAAGIAGAMSVHSVLAGEGFGIGTSGARPSPRLAVLARDAWLANLASFLTYRLDVLFVRHFTGTGGLGLYSTATGIAELGRMGPNAVGQASIREIGSSPETERGAVARRTLRRGVPGSLLLCTGLALASLPAVPFLYGEAFAPASALVGWLAPGIAVLAVSSVAASWLNVSGRSHRTARLSWAGTAVSAALSLLLIPVLGVKGAAIASSLSYGILAAMMWRAASRG